MLPSACLRSPVFGNLATVPRCNVIRLRLSLCSGLTTAIPNFGRGPRDKMPPTLWGTSGAWILWKTRGFPPASGRSSVGRVGASQARFRQIPILPVEHRHYRSAILSGLLPNALVRWRWADPVAALIMMPIIVKEGSKASAASVAKTVATTEPAARPLLYRPSGETTERLHHAR